MFSVIIANFIEHHNFPSTVLSALHSLYHSIITIVQSKYHYYPHSVEGKLPQGHTASKELGHSANPASGARPVFSTAIAIRQCSDVCVDEPELTLQG